MELKQCYVELFGNINKLLIVPYGIETLSVLLYHIHRSKLLIVPYGIETSIYHRLNISSLLLIVPYGIETV